MALVTYATGSVSCAQFCYCFVVLFCTPLNRGAGAIFLVVCDDDERTTRR